MVKVKAKKALRYLLEARLQQVAPGDVAEVPEVVVANNPGTFEVLEEVAEPIDTAVAKEDAVTKPVSRRRRRRSKKE